MSVHINIIWRVCTLAVWLWLLLNPVSDSIAGSKAIGAGEVTWGPEARRIVMAGDSWSEAAVAPLKKALPQWGFGRVVVTWQDTALPGSQAREWVQNHEGKLAALAQALQAEPPADILLLFIGGNDFNFKMARHGWSPARRDSTLDEIERDIQLLVNFSKTTQPPLTVVLVDYSYFNYPKMRQTYGYNLAPTLSDYNEAMVELGRRKLAIATRTAGCEYAHNFGILQHTYGDKQHSFPRPGHAPGYDPHPGGRVDLPAPHQALSDGLHPTPKAMRAILDNVFSQGLNKLLSGHPWPSS